jgi:uncharacterized protein (TIRG00374 family)
MRKLVVRVVLGIAAGIGVYVGFSIWADADRVMKALARFHWIAAVIACALALGNYAIRFGRWESFLRVLKIRLPVVDSALVFLAGFALTVTPGKLGEAVKAFLLRESHGIPIVRTAPIVIAERLTDLLALLLLALIGVFTFDVDRRFLAAGTALVAAAIAIVSVDRLAELALAVVSRLPVIGRATPKLRELHRSTALLLRPAPLLMATALSCAAWFLECLAFWVVVGGMPGAALTLRAATFIYSAVTVAGALSFLPGGLGLTEAGMLGLLVRFGGGLDRSSAAAATFVTRACTLWFAVALGLPALLAYVRRRHLHVERIDAAAPPSPSPAPAAAVDSSNPS